MLLTDQPGLFYTDPRHDPYAEMVKEITSPNIPHDLWNAAGEAQKGIGTGGMLTKLQAADLARRAGALFVIAAGDQDDVLLRLVDGEELGTHFKPIVSTMESRKRYILAGDTAGGTLIIDDGAVRALRNSGSLLPVGISAVEGTFERGDTVKVKDTNGVEIARGLVNYRSSDTERISGKHSDAIETILGYAYSMEIIHRNNLVLL